MKFDATKIRTLSADADDWNDLAQPYNMENSLYGVLLYPRKGIGKKRCLDEISEWAMYQLPNAGEASTDYTIHQRGEDWAIVYKIEGWYNHFGLDEGFD